MICTRCAEAADGVDFGPIPVCMVCEQGPIGVYNHAKPPERQSVRKHKRPGAKAGDTDYWCPGSKYPPRLQTGHDFCTGCDCAHLPAGTRIASKKE